MKTTKRNYKPQKRTLEAILKILLVADTKGDKVLSYTEIKTALKLSGFSSKDSERWEKMVPSMKLETIEKSGREKVIKFLNISEARKELKKLFMMHHNINIDASPEKKTARLRTLAPTKTVKITNKKNFLKKEEDFLNRGDINNIKFIIGGLLYKRVVTKTTPKVIPLSEVSTTLNNEFGTSVTRNELKLLITNSQEFELESTINEGSVRLAGDVEVSWEKIKENYSPQNDRREVLARISLTLAEIKNITELNCNLISEISPNEGIYRINFNKSRTDLFELVKLMRTFRGNDQIFDEDLTNEIQRESTKLDARALLSMSGYDIEIL